MISRQITPLKHDTQLPVQSKHRIAVNTFSRKAYSAFARSIKGWVHKKETRSADQSQGVYADRESRFQERPKACPETDAPILQTNRAIKS